MLHELGSGGEGTVYLAEHLMTDALRAIKISAHSMGFRSLHELEMMKNVSHPSLPHIIDVEQEENRIYLVMDYVPGRSLLEYAKQGRITEKFFFHAAEQLLDALEYLHTCQLPMLHLDVKPSNIIVRQDGRLVLLDLGAAMPLSSEREKDGCYGTAGYAAPEQWDCSMALTVRTDLYGFGATMYYLLNGRKCEEAAESGRARDSPERWRRKVERLLLICLERDPEKRPASVYEVRKVLKSVKYSAARRRTALQIFSALMMLGSVMLFSCRQTGSGNSDIENAQQKYEFFLEEAELSGDAQAYENYKKAILLCPDRMEAFQSYISRIRADLMFTLDEEAALQSLLSLQTEVDKSSIYEEIQSRGEEFGEFAHQLGITYWYFYEGSGGRSAAASWFNKAVKSASEHNSTVIWAREASIYARMGEYYEKLGKQELPGTDIVGPADYWKDLRELSQIVFLKKEDGETGKAVISSILEEQLNLLIFESAGLKEAGIQEESLLKSIQEMKEQGADQLLPGRCEDAESAVKRAYSAGVRGIYE